MLSASWFVVIRSYQQLNMEKFRVLHDLEKQLSYQFFILEWDPHAEGKKSNRYREADTRRSDSTNHLQRCS